MLVQLHFFGEDIQQAYFYHSDIIFATRPSLINALTFCYVIIITV